MKEEKQMKNDNECWPEGWVTFSMGGGCGTGTGRQSRRKRGSKASFPAPEDMCSRQGTGRARTLKPQVHEEHRESWNPEENVHILT